MKAKHNSLYPFFKINVILCGRWLLLSAEGHWKRHGGTCVKPSSTSASNSCCHYTWLMYIPAKELSWHLLGMCIVQQICCCSRTISSSISGTNSSLNSICPLARNHWMFNLHTCDVHKRSHIIACMQKWQFLPFATKDPQLVLNGSIFLMVSSINNFCIGEIWNMY